MKKETQKVMFSSEQTDWETPDWLFDLLNSEFEFTLDVCATKENAKTSKYITPKENALTKDWNSGVCWMNPPYGRDIGKWIAKAYEEAYKGNCTVVCLVPSRTDTKWWWNYVRTGEVRFLKGRLKFKGAENSAPFPSAIVIFRKNHRPWMQQTHYWEADGL